MAERHTVLVLGAGASKPYGFPLGAELVDRICRSFLHGFGVYFGDFDCRWEEGDCQEFLDRLRKSGRQSIDVFLEHNPSLAEIGKLAIAQSLTEREDTLFELDSQVRDPEDHWYPWLFQWLAQGAPDDFARKPLAIITYNYDRSLEHYLFTALRHAYEGIADRQAGELLQRVPVVHVHGLFGRLPWQLESVCPVDAPYGRRPRSGYQGLLDAAKHIDILHEGHDKTPAVCQAQELLAGAEKLIFLGFGYDETNLRRLKLAERLPPHITIHGTAFGLTDNEKFRKEQMIEGLATAPNRPHRATLQPRKTLDFLRHTGYLS